MADSAVPLTGEAEPAAVTHHEALRRAAQACRLLLLIGPPAAISLVVLVDEPSDLRRVGFAVFEVVTAILVIASTTHLLRRMAATPSDISSATRTTVASLALSASPWPIALVVLVPRTEGDTFLIMFFSLAAVASSLTASAAYEPFFVALVFPNLVPVTVLIAIGALSPAVPPGLALMSLLFMALLWVSFRLLNRTIVEAITGRQVEEALTVQLSEANARLVHRASHDDLTGLANRALFRDVLERHVATSRGSGSDVAVLYLDIDRFKVVNDSLGHVEGDTLLQEVAERLRGCIRSDDLLARLGGDEFTVVAPDIDTDAALRLGERIRSSFDEPFSVGGLRTVASVSVGVALGRGDVTAIDLMRYADSALYEAKGAGRNRVVLFDEALRASLSTRLERENALRLALHDHQFEAWLQPIVDPVTRQIVAVEALARWRHPRRGILAPGLFLPLMAECGLIQELDQDIARQARDALRSLGALAAPGFRIYINVSSATELLATTIERHSAAADEDSTPLSGLGIEITEQAIVSDPEAAARALAEARSRGLAVALDDVGTGYSSLSLIRALPLDGLKIDRSFIAGMDRDPADAAVVASVAALGRRLGLGVTAEGVETEGQLAALVAEGITAAQGFLFSGAVPVALLTDWLRDGPPWIASAQAVRVVR